MITRVVLKNWRAYQDLELNLRPGTTFVVARNGVGKSSLLEAVTFALFGDAIRPSQDAIRLGSKFAEATVEVKVPTGDILSVTRRLPKRLPKSRPAPVTAKLDGRELPGGSLESTLREIFHADSAFLGRVTMLRREDLETDASELNLQDHLSRFFGIDALRETLEELRGRKKDIEGDVQDIKDTVAVPPRRLQELRRQVENATQQVEQAEESLHEAERAAEASAQIVKQAEAFALWEQREKQRMSELRKLATEISSAVGRSVPAETLSDALNDAATEFEEQLDEVRRRRGNLEGRLAAIEGALEQLDAGAGSCPVCRRPLTSDDVDHAKSGHEQELEQLRSQLANLDEGEITERLRVVQKGLRRLVNLSVAESEESPDVSIEEARERQSAANATMKRAREFLVQRRAEKIALSTELKTAESDTRGKQLLESKFMSLGRVIAAIDTVDTTVKTILDGTIDPLAREVAGRWKVLFGNRGSLRLTSEGELSREVQGEPLYFRSFSTGEKMGAQLILRLMILDAATKATFCWIDEPLEHLDPDARRQVATMLAVTPRTTALEQLLVTTYEEPLARRLADRMTGDVDLVYVRAGDLDT